MHYNVRGSGSAEDASLWAKIGTDSFREIRCWLLDDPSGAPKEAEFVPSGITALESDENGSDSENDAMGDDVEFADLMFDAPEDSDECPSPVFDEDKGCSWDNFTDMYEKAAAPIATHHEYGTFRG